MDEWLRHLIDQWSRTGFVDVDELESVLADPRLTVNVTDVLEQLDDHGIWIENAEQRALRESAEGPPVRPVAATPLHHRDQALLDLVRGWGIPATDAISCRDHEGRLFEGLLLVPGEAAVGAWVDLRARLDAFPHWPVIGRHCEADSFPAEEFLHVDDSAGSDPDAARREARELIREAERLTPEPWTFRRWQRPDAPRPPDLPPVLDAPKSRPSHPSVGDLAWVLDQEFVAVRNLISEDFHPFVRIHLAPTPDPREVFAYWPFGGWNDSPWPEEQLTMVRHWNETFGAELISRPADYFEMVVWDPPTTRESALRLAEECIRFGEETIFGYGDIPEDERVRRARNFRVWYFWWG